MQYLTIWDLVLTPIFLIVLSFLAKRYRDKHFPVGHPLRRYYLPGLYAKFGGAIFIGLVYQYYYGGGDTYNYFTQAKMINSSLNESLNIWLDLLFHVSPDVNPQVYKYSSQMIWYGDSSSYTVTVIGALLGLLNGTTYMPTALLFAFISYSGIWAMYRTFTRIYPGLHKQLAIAFLFIPSTLVWGSSIFKDTICMFGLGWMTHCTFNIFVNKNLSLKNFILLCVSFYLIAIIKVYILLAFLPALGLWLLMTFSRKISSSVLRWIANIAFIAAVAAALVFFSGRFANELNRYSLDKIASTAKQTQDYITYVSENKEGSVYYIGELDGTFESMIKRFPQAVNVTLYRPYLWESKKPIMILSAIEASAFLILTLIIIFRQGIGNVFRKVFTDPNLSFFLIFTLIFAFAVGISTGNFGTLSRYKIPCVPFFSALLLILYYQSQAVAVEKKRILHARKSVHHFT